MANQVFVNDQSIIECHVIGDQSAESVNAMGKRIKDLFDQLKSQGKPLLALDDLTRMGSVPPEARSKVVSLAKSLGYDRLAMLGKSGMLRFGANLIIRASGRGRKLRYFTDRSQAVAWLLDKDNQS